MTRKLEYRILHQTGEKWRKMKNLTNQRKRSAMTMRSTISFRINQHVEAERLGEQRKVSLFSLASDLIGKYSTDYLQFLEVEKEKRGSL